VIRVAPPAPVFDDEERRAELVARRARVAQEVSATGVLVLFSAEPRVYTGDTDYPYRQENNLYYLTHLKQPGATLVLLPGNQAHGEILFLPRRNPTAEAWGGAMYSAEEARRLSGVREIWDSREFAPFMEALSKRQPYRPKPEAVLLSDAPARTSQAADASSRSASTANAQSAETPASGFEALFAASARKEAALYLLVPLRDADTGAFGDAREWRREQRFAESWTKTASGFNVRSAFHLFAVMRLRKSPSELQRLQHAIDITTEAMGRAMAVAGRLSREYEVEAEVLYTFRRRGADSPGFPSIIGAGANATTIHHTDLQGAIKPNDLLLMDIGAEFDHYTADITRTFPLSGRFTPAQADIYRIVLDAQEAAFKAVRPGATLSDVHNAAVEALKDGLLRLGLITNRNSAQYFIWFPHGTSHWLGMNAHDIGYGNAPLEPGMVLTVEPGLYIRADALERLPRTPENEKLIEAVRPAFEKYKNIGVRIEDDALVTPEGYRNLSAALPRTIPEIESFVERASRTMP
jgi:Xaa-Pro aminopeptidase